MKYFILELSRNIGGAMTAGIKAREDVEAILRQEGYDISYIHYTGVAPWYAKLGYRTFLRWTRNGFLPE